MYQISNIAFPRQCRSKPWCVALATGLSLAISFAILRPFLDAPYFGDDLLAFFALDHPAHLWGYFFHVGSMDHAFRPIESALLTVIQQRFWLNTIPIHLASIALHACLCGMTAYLAVRLGCACGETLLAAVLTAVSPEMATALLGNDCMSQVLSGTFAMLCVMLAYESYKKLDGSAPLVLIALWLLGALSYAISIFSKETGLGSIGGVVLITCLIASKRTGLGRRVSLITRLLSPYVIVVLFYFTARLNAGAPLRAREPIYQVHLGANVIGNIVLLLAGALSPVSSLRVAIAAQSHDRLMLLLACGLLSIVMLMLGVGVYRSKRKALLLAFLALSALFPAIVLSHVSELYLYSAFPFFALLIAVAARDIWSSISIGRSVCVLSLALLLAGFLDANLQKAWYMDRGGREATMMMNTIGYYARSLPEDGNIVLMDHRQGRPSYSIYISGHDLANLEVGTFNVAQFYARIFGRPDVKVTICREWSGCRLAPILDGS